MQPLSSLVESARFGVIERFVVSEVPEADFIPSLISLNPLSQPRASVEKIVSFKLVFFYNKQKSRLKLFYNVIIEINKFLKAQN